MVSAFHDPPGPVNAGGSCTVTRSPPAGLGGGGEGPVVCLGDAFDDCQTEADACVVGAYAFGAALKRLDKRGNQLWGELLAGVPDGERHSLGANAGRATHRDLFRQVVDDRVVHEVRNQLQQERVRNRRWGSSRRRSRS